MATKTGNTLDNWLRGTAENDVLYGLGGNDILYGLGGRDKLYGGDDRDVLVGGPGGDSLHGGAGNDVLVGSVGDRNRDTLNGEAGNDVLIGGRSDMFKGGAGADVLLGLGGGTAGYFKSPAGVTVNLATGRGQGGDAEGDVLIGIHAVVGGKYGDTLTGDEQDNYFRGKGGADVVDGGGGRDIAAFNPGDEDEGVTVDLGVTDADGWTLGKGGDAEGDKLKNIEILHGSHGDDTLRGDQNANELYGGGGDDVLEGRGGADILHGGIGRNSGNDTASYAHSPGGVTVNLADGIARGGDAQVTIDGVTSYDTLTSIENLEGSEHGDTLTGDGGGNWLTGRGGNDTLTGGGGSDVLEGGAGADILRGGSGDYDRAAYTESEEGVTVNLADGTARGGDAQVTIDGVTSYDTLTGIEDLEGSNAADELTGNGGNNYLAGQAGDDTLKGEGGNDELIGGLGQDTLSGGTGADTFIFDEADASPVGTRDVVTDFSGLGADGVKQASEEGDKLDLTDLTEGTTLSVEYQQFGTGSTAKTIVQVDVDGDGAIKTGEDFHLELTGHHDLTVADFEFDEGTVSVMEVSDIVIA